MGFLAFAFVKDEKAAPKNIMLYIFLVCEKDNKNDCSFWQNNIQ